MANVHRLGDYNGGGGNNNNNQNGNYRPQFGNDRANNAF